ncbi:MAG: flagellar hook-length control protein FliK [Rubrivivax sp.]|nr:MAG: flagellar hook-length control protein FliK [Rubrivivax sp.]
MLTSAQNVAPKPAALPPAVQNAQPATPAGVPSFAQFLNDQSATPPTPPADADASQQDDAPEPPAATPRRPALAARPASNTPNRAGDKAPRADVRTPTDPADAKLKAAKAVAEEDDSAETPELKEFTQLIGMTQPNATALPAPTTGKLDAALTAGTATPSEEVGVGRAAPRLSAPDASRTEPRDATTAKADDARAEAPDTAPVKSAALRTDKSIPHAGSEQPTPVTTPHASVDTPAATATVPSFAAAFAQAQAPTAATADALKPTFTANLHAPLHSPAFSPELGTRVSLMAVNGVQHAELQLNPAEMGPVNVQIVVDGGQAQVSFHAVQAETRQALEQSLPDLAAALQGQGLTLSGGGVFQQAPRDADHESTAADIDGTDRSSRRGGERIGATTGTASAPIRRSVGLLDTFA